MPAPAILAIGTCRLHTPLFAAAQAGRVELRVLPSNHYLHSPVEAVQLVRYLSGELAVPARYLPLMFDNNLGRPAYAQPFDVGALPERIAPDMAAQMRAFLQANDAVLLEVSSLRTFLADGFALQGVYLEGLLKGALPGRDDIDVHTLFALPPEQRQWSSEGKPEVEYLKQHVRILNLDQATVQQALALLRAALPKLVVCSHFSSEGMPPNVAEARRKLIGYVGTACAALDIPFLDPSVALQTLDSASRMLRPGDWHHYSTLAEHTVGKYYADNLTAIAISRA